PRARGEPRYALFKTRAIAHTGAHLSRPGGRFLFPAASVAQMRAAKESRTPPSRADEDLPVQPAQQGLHGGAQLVFLVHELLDPLLGVDDSGVVFPAELLADGWIAEPGDPPCQVHRDLPRARDALLPA